MTTAYISNQTGNFPLDKIFNNPRFRHLIAFSDEARDNGTILNAHIDFRSAEDTPTDFTPLRTALPTSWTITTNPTTNEVTYENTVEVVNTSGGTLSPNSIGIYSFVSFLDPESNWLTSHTMTLDGPRTTGTFTYTGANELSWDWLVAPNKIRITTGGEKDTIIEAASYNAIHNGADTDVTVTFASAVPGLDGMIGIIGVGFELAIIETFSNSYGDDESSNVTIKLFSGDYAGTSYAV